MTPSMHHQNKKAEILQDELPHLEGKVVLVDHQPKAVTKLRRSKNTDLNDETFQAQRLDVLINLSAALGATCSKGEICSVTCDFMKQLIQADRYSLLFFDPLKHNYSVFAYHGLPIAIDQLDDRPIAGSALEHVLSSGELLNIGNLHVSELIADKKTIDAEIASVMHCPINVFDDLVGTFTVAACAEHQFDELDEKYLSLVSIIVSRALESQSFLSETEHALDVAEKSEYELQLMNRMVEMSPVVLMNWGAYDDIPLEYVSKNVARIFGYVHEDIRDFDFIHPDDSLKVHEELKGNDQKGVDEFTQTYRLVNKNGEIRWVDDFVLIKRDANGVSTHYQSILLDITDRKQREAELLKTQKAAEAANMAKDQLLTNMSHELRTPLNAVVGFTQLLKFSQLDDDQLEYLKLVEKGGEDLLAIIENLLDLSTLEKEEYALSGGLIQLRAFLAERSEYAKFLSSNKPVDIVLDLDSNLPNMIYQDPDALKKVVDHLLENGVKFTERGTVCLKAWAVQDEIGRSTLQIAVCDTGSGISGAGQKQLFQAFTQVDGSLTRRFGGNGLGLAICSKLVKLMGGEISIKSQLGKGSSFTIEIPY